MNKNKKETAVADCTVLVVEDNPNNAMLMQDILKSQKIRSHIVENAAEAMEFCKGDTPTMILMDIGLPDMDGLELTKKMRDGKKLNKTPIIAVTAHASSSMKEKAMAVGCNDFIAKPFMPNDVIHTVKSHLVSS